MKKLILMLVLAVAFAGCCGQVTPPITPPPGGDEGAGTSLGAQTDWCNTASGEIWAATWAGVPTTTDVIVEGVKTVEGIQMCSIKIDYHDPDAGESGTLRMYYSEDGEDMVYELYDDAGNLVTKWKTINGVTTFYDEEGNPVEIPGYT